MKLSTSLLLTLSIILLNTFATAATIEPQWPQKFSLSANERTGFPFVASQSGTATVTVQSQGVPLVISILRPGGTIAAEKQGSGIVTIPYTITAADIQQGVLWGVQIRTLHETPTTPRTSDIHQTPVNITVRQVASGSLSVQHPPGDLARAKSELQSKASRAHARQNRVLPATDMNVAAQKKNKTRQDVTSQQMQTLSYLKALPSSARANASRIPVRIPGGIKGANTGATGQGGMNTLAPFAISGLSANSGKPGDPVLISGSSFGNQPGKVHFIIGKRSQDDIRASIISWSDTQIIAQLPSDLSGVNTFDGALYVQRNGAVTPRMPFRFNPTIDYITLTQETPDRSIAQLFTIEDGNVCHPMCRGGLSWEALVQLVSGNSQNDVYYQGSTLKNGWVVDSAYLAFAEYVNGKLVDLPGPRTTVYNNGTMSSDAYIVQSFPGSTSPQTVVHWWYDAGGANANYSPRIVIRGPLGVPYF